MGKRGFMDSSRRRRFLQTVAGISTIGLAGCSLFSSEQPGENQEEPPEITDTPTSTPTSTPVPVPDDASFSFDYSGGSLTIRLTSGGPIPASNLVIRSSGGTQVRWHELGSTAVPASGSVTSGDTATIGSSVLNWPNAVEQSDTIRVVFVTEGGSPTTLGMYEPSATETPTETSDDTPTETPEDTDERVALSFESGTVGSSSLPSPWYIIRDSGSVSITDNSSEGNKAIQLVSESDLEPIAVGVDVDFSEVNQILADMYPVDVSPGWGYVKFLLDEPDRSNGHIHTRDHPGRTAHGGSHTEAFRDGEWHSDIEFFKNTGNGTLLSDISGTHTLILHTSGSNDVIWDNIRFQDASENLIPLRNIID